MVTAFAAQLALGWQHLVAGVVFRCFQDAHLLEWEAAFVEDAEHGVAVDDQVGDVGDGRRIGLLLA